jgi:hypothetical protein
MANHEQQSQYHDPYPDYGVGHDFGTHSVFVTEQAVCLRQLLSRVEGRRIEDVDPEDRKSFFEATEASDQKFGEYNLVCRVEDCLSKRIAVSRGIGNQDPVEIQHQGTLGYCIEQTGMTSFNRSQPGDDRAEAWHTRPNPD